MTVANNNITRKQTPSVQSEVVSKTCGKSQTLTLLRKQYLQKVYCLQSFWLRMEYCLAFIFLTCWLTVMAQHSKLEPGMPGNDAPPGTHKMSFKPPNLDQEQQWSQHMPSALTCEACKAITHNVSTFISWFIYIHTFYCFLHGWELHNTQRTPLLAMASDAT